MSEKKSIPSGLTKDERLTFIVLNKPKVLNIDLNELRCISQDTYFQYQVQYSHLDEMIHSVNLYDTWLKNKHDLESKNINELFVLV